MSTHSTCADWLSSLGFVGGGGGLTAGKLSFVETAELQVSQGADQVPGLLHGERHPEPRPGPVPDGLADRLRRVQAVQRVPRGEQGDGAHSARPLPGAPGVGHSIQPPQVLRTLLEGARVF